MTTWMITSAFFALCLHGAIWFGANLKLGSQQPLTDTQLQMGFALAWMVGALAMWRLSLPASRLHAVSTIMLGALFVTLLGNLGALGSFIARGVQLNENFLSAFALYRGLKVLLELVLAVPSAILLQGLALTRAKAA